MTLVDTSICIPYLRGIMSENEHNLFADQMARRELGITQLVWVELYQGIQNPKEERELKFFLTLIKMFEFDQACWNETARIAHISKMRGVNAPLSDIQIQACALRYDLQLLHNDKHFDLIQDVLARPQ